METLNKLISELGFDNDEFCEVDTVRLKEAISRNLTKLKENNQSFGDVSIIPLSKIKSKALRKEVVDNLGCTVLFRHDTERGKLIGIAEDDMDYYYVVRRDDGSLHYNTCVDYITYSR